MSNEFDIYDISAIASILEQLGTKEKFWFNGFWDDFDEQWLFKFSRTNTGEHWSEKAAEQLCLALEIPHAVYHLARSVDRLGVITKNLVPEGFNMIMGNQLLYTMNPVAYPRPEDSNETFMHVKEHTIESIFEVFDNYSVLPPRDFQSHNEITPYYMKNPEGMDACDVFCGYLLLDVLISNQDRHHENWAILEAPDSKRYLCPTFDHAASLGRELLDNERIDRLTTRDKGRKIDHFVKRATSEIFASNNGKKPLSTIDAFFESVKYRQDTKRVWLAKLKELSDEKIATIFDKMPDSVITPKAREFAVAIVSANIKRLLEDERS